MISQSCFHKAQQKMLVKEWNTPDSKPEESPATLKIIFKNKNMFW